MSLMLIAPFNVYCRLSNEFTFAHTMILFASPPIYQLTVIHLRSPFQVDRKCSSDREKTFVDEPRARRRRPAWIVVNAYGNTLFNVEPLRVALAKPDVKVVSASIDKNFAHRRARRILPTRYSRVERSSRISRVVRASSKGMKGMRKPLSRLEKSII